MTADPASVFDFEAFLKSDDFAALNILSKRQTTIQRTSGSLSTIASICTIVHILRSHHGLSTTYHRLVSGLAIGDILFSFFGYILGTIMIPKEYGYIVPGGMGSQASCDAQGFLLTFGGGMALTYNMSICIYYLAIVTFNKKDNYIRIKLEPWFHGLSILINLALCSAILAINGYNIDGIGSCWFTTNIELPHCMGLESGEIRDGFTIPCGRGDGKEHPVLYRFLFILGIVTILLLPVVIAVTMALMYHTVRKAEKTMQKYGVGALRLRKKGANKHLGNITNGNASISNNSPRGSPPSHPHDKDSENDSRFSFIQWLKANYRKIPFVNSCCNSGRNTFRPTTISSQKRAILHRAMGYVTGWGLTWIPFFVVAILQFRGEALGYIFALLNPLQGVFNFIAYMLPKVRNAKKGPTKKRSRVKHGGAGNDNHVNAITWRKAFLKAYMSRGPKKMSGQQHHIGSHGSSNGSWSSSILKALKKWTTSTTALSIKQPMNKNSNNGVVNTNQPQKKHPPVPGSGQEESMISIAGAPLPAENNNDYISPTPTLERNVYVSSSPPLVLSKDADDLEEEGENGEHHLNNNNDPERMNNEDIKGVLDDFYFSEEIQSILE